LNWWEPLRLIRSLVLQTGRRIVGADVVELAPNPALPHADFTAARMVYALMGMGARVFNPCDSDGLKTRAPFAL